MDSVLCKMRSVRLFGVKEEASNDHVQAPRGLSVGEGSPQLDDQSVQLKNRLRVLSMSLSVQQNGACSVCQVEGCSTDLSSVHLKTYHRRNRICEEHVKASSIMVNGITSRFCQQCHKCHEIEAFDSNRRSCRAKLQKRAVQPSGSAASPASSSGDTKPHQKRAQGKLLSAIAAGTAVQNNARRGRQRVGASPYSAENAVGVAAYQECGEKSPEDLMQSTDNPSEGSAWSGKVEEVEGKLDEQQNFAKTAFRAGKAPGMWEQCLEMDDIGAPGIASAVLVPNWIKAALMGRPPADILTPPAATAFETTPPTAAALSAATAGFAGSLTGSQRVAAASLMQPREQSFTCQMSRPGCMLSSGPAMNHTLVDEWQQQLLNQVAQRTLPPILERNWNTNLDYGLNNAWDKGAETWAASLSEFYTLNNGNQKLEDVIATELAAAQLCMESAVAPPLDSIHAESDHMDSAANQKFGAWYPSWLMERMVKEKVLSAVHTESTPPCTLAMDQLLSSSGSKDVDVDAIVQAGAAAAAAAEAGLPMIVGAAAWGGMPGDSQSGEYAQAKSSGALLEELGLHRVSSSLIGLDGKLPDLPPLAVTLGVQDEYFQGLDDQLEDRQSFWFQLLQEDA